MGAVSSFQTKKESQNLDSHVLDSEQAVLGILLMANSTHAEICDSLASDMFSEPAHQFIYLKIGEIINSGRAAIPNTVAEACRSNLAFQNIGGHSFLMDLVEKAPPVPTVGTHSAIIHSAWRRRSFQQLGLEIAALASNDDKLIPEKISQEMARIEAKAVADGGSSPDVGVARIFAEYENNDQPTGVLTGLHGIDAATGGFGPGELWIASGRPSMGKSAFALTAALNAACRGFKSDGVIVINCEMTESQMYRRMTCDLAYHHYGSEAPSYAAIKQKTLTAREQKIFYQAGREFQSIKNLHVEHRHRLTVDILRSIVRKKILVWKKIGIEAKLVVVDHVGLIRPSGKNQNRSADQGEIARDLKEAASVLNVAILALAQLNRQVENRDDKRPTLADMRDSGEFEENADGVIGFYREAYYAEREPEPKNFDKRALWEERRASRSVEAILLKVREGQCQTVKLWADMARNAIRNEAPQNAYGAPIGSDQTEDPFDLR